MCNKKQQRHIAQEKQWRHTSVFIETAQKGLCKTLLLFFFLLRFNDTCHFLFKISFLPPECILWYGKMFLLWSSTTPCPYYSVQACEMLPFTIFVLSKLSKALNIYLQVRTRTMQMLMQTAALILIVSRFVTGIMSILF